MSIFKNFLIFFILLLNGCTLTKGVWEPKMYNEGFKNYFLDEQRNHVVLIGENKFVNDKEGFSYLINLEKYENLESFFRFGKNKILEISLVFPIAKDSTITTPFWIGFRKKDLSYRELEFLKQKGCGIGKDKVGCRYESITLLRYSASIDKIDSSKLLPLIERRTSIEEESNFAQTTEKVLITPFTLAADIVLLPITIPYFIYWQVKESQTSHFCEGEFCGYKKDLKNSR